MKSTNVLFHVSARQVEIHLLLYIYMQDTAKIYKHFGNKNTGDERLVTYIRNTCIKMAEIFLIACMRTDSAVQKLYFSKTKFRVIFMLYRYCRTWKKEIFTRRWGANNFARALSIIYKIYERGDVKTIVGFLKIT